MTLPGFEIPKSQWSAGDISTLLDAVAEAGADPESARAARGSITLDFVDRPEGHPYSDPAVVDFLQKSYAQIPHLLYFLNPDRDSGVLDTFYASIGALHRTPLGVWVMWSDDVADAFFETLTDAAEFAIEQGDDWVAMVESYEYDESQTRFSEIRQLLITRGALRG